ncbi:MAG: UDP-N-acetylglucosamine 1-carboxyvinyltransferase [bacterium]|nr:UDP-N-acetylglucosamine 1-carboxyvinyltransferase [bacterium]
MRFLIRGGNKLSGEIKLAGAKNAATKMLIASLLTSEPCILENFPDIGDAKITEELCRAVGSHISKSGNTLTIETPEITNFKVVSLTRRNRIPILALGPLLARVGKAEVPMLGGDKIGPRPVDIHIDALTAMGAKIEVLEDRYVAIAPDGLHGTEVRLRYPSVGATENTILAAVLAKGRTEIQNAALEPEILDLIKLLQKMGAIIEFGANRTIYIDGVESLHGATHRIMPDRNEAISFACLAVATNGRILVKDARQETLSTFLSVLRRVGGDYQVSDGGIEFWKAVDGPLRPTAIETDTYPGFMTDWQQPVAVLLTQANGVSTLHETVYEDRFGYAQDLNLMGAEIKVQAKCLGEVPCRFAGKTFLHSAEITGPSKLHSAKLTVRDLRSGIAHVIAALVAEGESEIDGIEELDRGYENLDERLRKLGADIKRLTTND